MDQTTRYSLAVPALENSSSEELGDTTAVLIVHSPRAGRRKRGEARRRNGGLPPLLPHIDDAGHPQTLHPFSVPPTGTPRTSIKGGTIAAVHAVSAPQRPHTAGAAAAAAAAAAADPRNFLLAGGSGARALDSERAKAQAAVARAAARDLRGSNAALAAELARMQAEREREAGALRGELLSLAGRFKAEQVGVVGA